MTPLPPGFLARPFAHRALHGPGVAENSEQAIVAAYDGRWGIEIDVQLTADGKAVVFHDEFLHRLTGRNGRVRDLTLREITSIPLLAGGTILPLDIALLFAGSRSVVIEIKDQSGDMTSAGVGPLESAVGRALYGHEGPVAVMSFNPYSVKAMADLRPDVPRGLVTCAWDADDWPNVLAVRRFELRGMPGLIDAGCSFVSHDRTDLASPEVARVKALGLPVLCWTIRSPVEAAEALVHADQITFEGYTPVA